MSALDEQVLSRLAEETDENHMLLHQLRSTVARLKAATCKRAPSRLLGCATALLDLACATPHGAREAGERTAGTPGDFASAGL